MSGSSQVCVIEGEWYSIALWQLSEIDVFYNNFVDRLERTTFGRKKRKSGKRQCYWP